MLFYTSMVLSLMKPGCAMYPIARSPQEKALLPNEKLGLADNILTNISAYIIQSCETQELRRHLPDCSRKALNIISDCSLLDHNLFIKLPSGCCFEAYGHRRTGRRTVLLQVIRLLNNCKPGKCHLMGITHFTFTSVTLFSAALRIVHSSQCTLVCGI